MASRPRYKQLYLQAQQAYKEEQDVCSGLRQRLEQIRNVLSPYGQQIIKQFPSSPEALSLNPHDYLCVSECFRSQARYGSSDIDQGFQQLTWQGRPIREQYE